MVDKYRVSLIESAISLYTLFLFFFNWGPLSHLFRSNSMVHCVSDANSHIQIANDVLFFFINFTVCFRSVHFFSAEFSSDKNLIACHRLKFIVIIKMMMMSDHCIYGL